jgi:hypothetical protein
MEITFAFLEYFFMGMDGRTEREQQALSGAADEPNNELCSPSVVSTNTKNKTSGKHR